MSEAQTALVTAWGTVDTCPTAITDGINNLATITAEMSSDEVARHPTAH